MDGLGAIKEGTELEDYDTKYSFFRALGYTSAELSIGTVLVGGVAYASYLKYFKPKSKSKQVKQS